MRKVLLITASLALTLSSLAGCSNGVSPNTITLNDQTVEVQSASSVTLSMKKDASSAVKAPSNSIKELNFEKDLSKAKQTNNQQKTVEDLVIKFKPSSTAKNTIYPTGYFQDERQLAVAARFALQSMNQASSYENGYRIGMSTLESIARDGVYVGRLSWAAGNATRNWENGYKVVAAAMQHMADQRPNTAYEACALASRMMGACNSYEDGYRAGYGAMQVVAQTDNYSVRSIANMALSQASSAYSYQDSYNIIQNGFRQISYAK